MSQIGYSLLGEPLLDKLERLESELAAKSAEIEELRLTVLKLDNWFRVNDHDIEQALEAK